MSENQALEHEKAEL
jgi:chromosome segregation ATPase